MRAEENAGKSMTIHTIPAIVAKAFPKVFSTKNITSGFRSSGIYPFHHYVFPNEKFLPSGTSDRHNFEPGLANAESVTVVAPGFRNNNRRPCGEVQ